MMAASSRPQFVDPLITFPSMDPSKQTRLLHLASTGEKNCITCQLSVITISEPPPYEALSYVWGSTDDLKLIQVDGYAFKVTQNLYMALKQLVPQQDDSVRALWIDAICINQGTEPTDLAERSQQVRLMSRIFLGATNVIAYLGEPYLGVSEVMELLTVAARDQRPGVDQLTQRVGYNAAQLYRDLILFFNQPWWDRTWTVQEPVAGRQVSFYFGRLGISFNTVHDGMTNIRGPHMKDLFKHTDGHLNQECRLCVAWLKIAQLGIYCGRFVLGGRTLLPGTLLLNMLGGFRNRGSGDPRDKIFGLIGLFPSDTLINLDYTISPESLFENFTLAWIQRYQDLEILGYLCDPDLRVHKNIPSYTVDWSYKASLTNQTFSKGRVLRQKETFNTCKGSKAVWQRKSTGQICANGFVFDSIKAIGGKNILQLGCSWEDVFKKLQGIVDMAHLLSGNDRQRSQTLMTIRYTLCCSFRRKDYKYTRLGSEIDELALDPWWGNEIKHCPRELEFLDTVWSSIWDRSFIFTENGSMGLAPNWCSTGDVIAIMAGAAMPIILRPVREVPDQRGDGISAFEVVGEAYIHGFMDGQAFDVNGRTEGDFDNIYLV